MPNIEIHGYKGQLWMEGVQKKDEILHLLKHSNFKDEAVVTLCNDACVDVYGKPQPYLRICGTIIEQLDKIVEILEPIKMDKEVLVITKFILKKE